MLLHVGDLKNKWIVIWNLVCSRLSRSKQYLIDSMNIKFPKFPNEMDLYCLPVGGFELVS